MLKARAGTPIGNQVRRTLTATPAVAVTVKATGRRHSAGSGVQFLGDNTRAVGGPRGADITQTERSGRLRRAGLVVIARLAALPAVGSAVVPAAADGNEAPASPAFRSITAGTSHTCAILDNGTVRCWGHNDYGQLGLGDITNRGDGPGEMGDNLPAVDLGAGRTATAISAGGNHTCALLDNKHVTPRSIALRCDSRRGAGR